MAKDPAFLFYPSDFVNGTLYFSIEERGNYITLLCALHANGGYMAMEDIKIVCPGASVKVLGKLTKADDGRFFQQRLLEEITKRKKWVESRVNNRLGGTNKKESVKTHEVTHENHVNKHMVNENRNEIINEFEIFYNTYDKKRGKEKSLHYWKQLTPEERKACLLAVPKYTQATEKQFRKDPERYLKHKCWQDEVLDGVKVSPVKKDYIKEAMQLFREAKNISAIPEAMYLDLFKQLPFHVKRQAPTPEHEVRNGGMVTMTQERKVVLRNYLTGLFHSKDGTV